MTASLVKGHRQLPDTLFIDIDHLNRFSVDQFVDKGLVVLAVKFWIDQWALLDTVFLPL